MNHKLTQIAKDAIVESLSDPDTAKELIGSAVTGLLDLNNYQTKEAIKKAALEAVREAVITQIAVILQTEEYKKQLQAKVAGVVPELIDKLAERALANVGSIY